MVYCTTIAYKDYKLFMQKLYTFSLSLRTISCFNALIDPTALYRNSYQMVLILSIFVKLSFKTDISFRTTKFNYTGAFV